MQDNVLSCGEARMQVAGYLDGEPCPALAAHLAQCEACLGACLEEALRRPLEVVVPTGFRQRVLARLPEVPPAEAPEYSLELAAAACLFAAFGAALWWSGEIPSIVAVLTEALGQPTILAAALAIETALSLYWLWRVSTEEQ